jgi:hypothetical protein
MTGIKSWFHVIPSNNTKLPSMMPQGTKTLGASLIRSWG